jgi:hypothetical protein
MRLVTRKMEMGFMNTKGIGGVAVCTLLTLGGTIARAQTAPNQVTIPFTDPSRPGTLKVNMMSGSINVRVGSGRDVVVNTVSEREPDDVRDRERERDRERSRARGRTTDDPAAGLRRLTQPAGVNIEEENNIVSVSAPIMVGAVKLDIQVPVATSLVLRAVNGGEVTVEGVNGSIEVNNVNGSIRLTDIGGPVIAHATNGRVIATLRQVTAGKPMSFTSFNGNVDVTLPGSAKANLKLRSDRGDVYTDFDVQTTPATARTPADTQRDDDRRRDRAATRGNARYRLEMDRSIFGSVNGGGPDVELRTFNGNIYLRKAK